jgi:beta-lactamase regulating signal transducer with metallopeptidase domain
METLFLKLLNMGIAAGWVILAVMLLRILLRKAPKAVRCALWILVGIRLVCPFSIESVLSLIPSQETVPGEIMMAREPEIDSGIRVLDDAVNPAIAASLSPEPHASVNPMQIVVFLASRLWAAGLAALLFYALASYVRLRRKVAAAMCFRENIWLCDAVRSPFILGILSPRIYLPSDLEEPQIGCVIAHEKAHLRRRDHWWKPLGFLLLSVYWFQPLCWAAYILLCRDIELACDEYVVKRMGDAWKKTYAKALLSCSLDSQGLSGCPLAFGEVGIKERIKGILSYKKPALWIVAAAAIACIVTAVCFLTDPAESKNSDNIYGTRYTVAEVLYDAPWYNAVYAPGNAPDFVFTPEGELLQRNFGGVMGNNPVWNMVGVFHESSLTGEGLLRFFAPAREALPGSRAHVGEETGNGAGETETGESPQGEEAGMDAVGLSQEARELLESAEQVWRVDSGRKSGSAYRGMTGYFVVRTDRNEVLLAACYGEAGMEEGHPMEGEHSMEEYSGEHIRWLWRVERQADAGDTMYLAALIASMSSDRNPQIFALYESDTMPDRLLAGYLDDSGRRGFALFLKDSSSGGGWKIKGFGPIQSDAPKKGQAFALNEAFGHVTIGEEWNLGHSVTIAASNSGDLASVTAEAGGRTQEVSAGGNSVPDMFVFEWSRVLTTEEAEAVRVRYYNALGEEIGLPFTE